MVTAQASEGDGEQGRGGLWLLKRAQGRSVISSCQSEGG